MAFDNLKGIVAGITGKGSGVPAAPTEVDNQLVAAFGTDALTASTQPQNMVLIANYYGLPLTSLKFSLEVTDTTGGTTAPSGVTAIETVLKTIQLQTKSGVNLLMMDGTQFDLSLAARYLTQGGIYNPSPIPADSAVSTAYPKTWNIILPLSVRASDFPLKLFVTYNTLGSRATTLNSMTSSVNYLNVYGNFSQHAFVPAMIKTITIPEAATGNINLQQYLDQGKTYLFQAYEYGTPSTTDATQDNPIGEAGTGITFSRNGSLEVSNAPLQTFIDKENIAFPNTISAGVGHVYGVIDLFTTPFTASAATQLSINFTSAPSGAGTASSMRAIWVEAL